MTDIVTRLRECNVSLELEAADEIERLRKENAQTMGRLATALNQNPRLKYCDMNVRRAAGDVCDAYASMSIAVTDLVGDQVTTHEAMRRLSAPDCVALANNVMATVRALSDALGREPR